MKKEYSLSLLELNLQYHMSQVKKYSKSSILICTDYFKFHTDKVKDLKEGIRILKTN